MQIGGFGSSHSTSAHHVTNCIHDHHEALENIGAMTMKASASAEASGTKTELQPEGQFSLSAWLKNMLGNSRGLLMNFRGDGQAASGSIEGSRATVRGTGGSHAAVSMAAAQAGTPDAAAVPSVTLQQLNDNTCLISVSDAGGDHKQTFWQRVKVRFNNASGQLIGRRRSGFFGFQAKNSFQAGQEKPEDDLRKNNRYRKDTVEINCARTEDSYLMDSYDRRGEYSRLTTTK